MRAQKEGDRKTKQIIFILYIQEQKKKSLDTIPRLFFYM